MSFNFDKLTTEIVADWALGTLEEWLEGWTAPQDDVPIQYRARPQDDGTWLFEPMTYSSEGYRERPVQRFEVRIAVTEIQP
ncbi:hypothetical protein [Amycolatopsis saalfeldensis]|uniref:Uncharacterized protein n=1 Tax=Amycolatopsis saalfeldensis TaxID=394193 RepID=A0A1H8YNB2_9PSEU|nr:hypothetical protein [Amycolatopsis saalfeldensis]SEP53649.1 hypothetical protein SAMN04489732_12974 [Amycolatopsis saalfeldensis]